jgi:hypothetical protein
MKLFFKKKKKGFVAHHPMCSMSMLLGGIALVGITMSWVALISWEQLNRQAVSEYTARVVQRELMKR